MNKDTFFGTTSRKVATSAVGVVLAVTVIGAAIPQEEAETDAGVQQPVTTTVAAAVESTTSASVTTTTTTTTTTPTTTTEPRPSPKCERAPIAIIDNFDLVVEQFDPDLMDTDLWLAIISDCSPLFWHDQMDVVIDALFERSIEGDYTTRISAEAVLEGFCGTLDDDTFDILMSPRSAAVCEIWR